MWSTTPVPLMPSSSSPRHKKIAVVGVGKLERDDNVEIPSGVFGGFIASSSHRRRRRVASTRGGMAGTTAAHERWSVAVVVACHQSQICQNFNGPLVTTAAMA
jgi:hypothetical protein